MKDIPHGYCQCGCGSRTPLATKTATQRGHAKGQPLAYVHGHNRRKSGIEYLAIDRGFSSPCWIWQRGRSGRGYGMTSVNGRQVYAHRALWERQNGPIPEGLELDHLCRVHECVRPDHLEPVTHKLNMHRGVWVKPRGRPKRQLA